MLVGYRVFVAETSRVEMKALLFFISSATLTSNRGTNKFLTQTLRMVTKEKEETRKRPKVSKAFFLSFDEPRGSGQKKR